MISKEALGRCVVNELRIGCCIGGCRRSWKDDGSYAEIICGRHWKMASSLLRNRSKRLRAAIRKLERKPDYRHTVADRKRLRRLHNLHNVVFQRIKRAAADSAERPVGLDAALAEIGVR